MLITVIAFLIVFTSLAIFHELGHLIWAKRAGIRVFEFGLGFGPRLFAFEFHQTTYSINLFPILAFVRIAGEGDSLEAEACPQEEMFFSKTPLQKFKALIAGPLMNIFIAFVLLSVVFSFVGVPDGITNEVGSIVPGSVAEKAGLQVGDRIVALNNQPIAKMEEAIKTIHQSSGKKLSLSVSRHSNKLTIIAAPAYNSSMKVSLLGFTPKPAYKRVNPPLALFYGLEQTLSMIGLTLAVLFKLIVGGISITDLAGPVGIAQVTGKYAQSGLISLVLFAAFLNVNIGVLNLLPIPALDGGQIVFVFLEWIIRKPIDPKLINKINSWGFVLLLLLMALVTFSDLRRLFGHP